MKTRRECILSESDLLVDKLPDGQLEVRELLVDKDGDKYYHRYVVHPGMATEEKDTRVDVLAKRIHTPKVVTDFWEAERTRQVG